MSEDRGRIFVHSTAYKPKDNEPDWDNVEWRQEPIPFYGTVWNEHQQLLMFCVALATDTMNRLWVTGDIDPDESVIWYEVTGMRHE